MKPRGLMTAVILLAVSAAVIAGVTLAWYDSFKAAQTENLVLKSEGQLVSVDGYKIFTSGGVESTLPSGNTIKLKSYDSVFGKNSETPMYILVPVRGQAVREAGHMLHFEFDCGSGPLMDETDNTKIKPLFSNVAQLRYVTVAANEVP
ncbi:MAG: hypothetical protein PUB32_00890, partial [Clostridiales bacterium]|nr:hypothetical protein [Clostridiales bacterium]